MFKKVLLLLGIPACLTAMEDLEKFEIRVNLPEKLAVLALFHAVQQNRHTVVKELLDCGVSATAQDGETGETIFHYVACKQNEEKYLQVIDTLFEGYIPPQIPLDYNGYSAIYRAASHRKMVLLRKLIEHENKYKTSTLHAVPIDHSRNDGNIVVYMQGFVVEDPETYRPLFDILRQHHCFSAKE